MQHRCVTAGEGPLHDGTRTGGTKHPDGQAPQPTDHGVQHGQRGGVGPLEVVDHQQDRVCHRFSFDEVDDELVRRGRRCSRVGRIPGHGAHAGEQLGDPCPLEVRAGAATVERVGEAPQWPWIVGVAARGPDHGPRGEPPPHFP